MVEEVLNNKKAYKKFKEFVRFQNGDLSKFNIKEFGNVCNKWKSYYFKRLNYKKSLSIIISIFNLILIITLNLVSKYQRDKTLSDYNISYMIKYFLKKNR